MKKTNWLFLLLSIAFSGTVYFILNRVPDPPGVNGYFYIKQIWSLGELNQFYFRDYSLAFFIPSALYKLGFNELTCFRLSISFFMGLFLWNSLFLSQYFYPKLKIAIPLALFSVALNMSLFELSFGYMKNFAALCLFFSGLNFWLLFKTNRSQKWLSLALLFFFISLLFHKSSFILVALFFASIILLNFKWKWLLWSGILTLLGIISFSLLFSQGQAYIVYLTNTLTHPPKDFFLWQVNLIKQFKNFAPFGFIYLIIGSVLLLKEYKIQYNSTRTQLLTFLFLLGFITWIPFHQASEDEVAYRFMLIFTSLALPVYLALSLREKTFPLLFSLLIVFNSVQFFYSRGLVNHFTFYSELKEPVSQITKWVQPEDHITCPHGLEFFVDYTTGLRCKIYPLKDSNKKSFRIAYAPPGLDWMLTRQRSHLYGLLKISEHFFLMTEETWQKIVQETKPPETWQNKMELRPAHIYDHP